MATNESKEPMTSDVFEPTVRTKIRRMPQRANYEREVIFSILDEGFICHLGFATDGLPVVIATSYGRIGDHVFIHGSAASRAAKVTKGAPSARIDVCLTVTLLDGLVLARSAVNHSMNYRSVVLYGQASLVLDADEKWESLRAISEHIIKGRWDDVRPPTSQELKGTAVLKLPVTAASAKVRTGPPEDDEEDYALPVWAGVIPLDVRTSAPIGDPRMDVSTAGSLPDYVLNYRRP